MKKMILASLGLIITTVIVYAAAVSTVGFGDKESGGRVDADEFNQIIDTIKGINTDSDPILELNPELNPDPTSSESYNLGINVPPVAGVDLTVGGTLGGVMATVPSSSIPVCNAESAGTIYFNANNKHFWGCKGDAGWKQLDEPACS